MTATDNEMLLTLFGVRVQQRMPARRYWLCVLMGDPAVLTPEEVRTLGRYIIFVKRTDYGNAAHLESTSKSEPVGMDDFPTLVLQKLDIDQWSYMVMGKDSDFSLRPLPLEDALTQALLGTDWKEFRAKLPDLSVYKDLDI